MATNKKQSSTENENDDVFKTSFLLKKTIGAKLKYITVVDSAYKSQTEVVDKLLSDFIEKWEKKNGEIKLK